MHDIGPLLTHRVEIVRLALEGKTTSEIVRIMRNSPSAITNYVGAFTRCTKLAEQKLQVGQIAFLLRRGPRLIRQYLALLEQCRRQPGLPPRATPRLGKRRRPLLLESNPPRNNQPATHPNDEPGGGSSGFLPFLIGRIDCPMPEKLNPSRSPDRGFWQRRLSTCRHYFAITGLPFGNISRGSALSELSWARTR